MVVSYNPRRDGAPPHKRGIGEEFNWKSVQFPSRWGSLLTTMMSNLGHLWTYDHLCIKESPMHPNTCRTRVISMHCLCFKIYNSCFSQIPRFVGAASTPSWCPREILRPLLSELVIRLPLRSAFRFCLRHQEGVELQKFLTYSHSSLIPHGSL